MKVIIGTGVVFAFTSILMSALGSHAVKQTLLDNMAGENYSLANQFTMYHGLALIVIGILYHIFPDVKFNYVAWMFVAGSIMFQGILYLKSFYPDSKLGFFNPIGGSVLMLAWLYFLFLIIRIK